MSERVVYLNGQWVPEREAKVSIYDSGLVSGDMAYEVTRTIAGRPFRLRSHLERLEETLHVVRAELGVSLDELERLTLETLARNAALFPDEPDWQIIHNASRGPSSQFPLAFPPEARRPTLSISCYPIAPRLARLAPAYSAGVEVVVPAQPAIPGQWLPCNAKVRGRLQFLLANLQAEESRPGSWPVLVDPDGCVTEGTSFNIIFVRQGALRTAPIDDVLPGVTRGLILELAAELGVSVFEDRVPLAAARQSDEAFITSTSIGLLHVHTFDGRRCKPGVDGPGSIGPVSERLRRALHDRVGLDFAAQARACAAAL